MVSLAELDRILPRVGKPARYVGNEWNSVRKDWAAGSVRIVLAYPDVYEVGMSNLGLAILYDIINSQEHALAERVYAPWPDMKREMREAGLPLYSLESYRPLRDFDVVGFSLQHELNYTNVLSMLDLADIPVLAAQRGDAEPLVIAGGSCAYNPEPMADFIDLFVLGEGEEVILELMDGVRHWKRLGANRTRVDLLRSLSQVPGVYVPSLYQVTYRDDGSVGGVAPTEPAVRPVVTKRIVTRLPNPPTDLIVPFVRPVHDRATLEIQRGCTQGCRFCQAGMIYRPVRQRSCTESVEAAEQMLDSTGYEEMALVSLSATDHPQIESIVRAVLDRKTTTPLGISLPSLRIDSFSVDLADMIQRTRKTGLTFAPEAGSQRLRNVINKKVTEEDVLKTADTAYGRGWTRLKLYFMIGLPTETDEDVEAIAALVRMVLKIGRKHHPSRAKVNVSAATFVPKPHTPYQWLALEDRDRVLEKQRLLRRLLRDRRIHLSWHDYDSTLLEATLARGDRRVGAAIVRAWREGAEFDAWSEHFSYETWEGAFAAEGLGMQFYASRMRSREEVLAWDHLSSGVRTEYLWGEYLRSLQAEVTRDCRQGCTRCGIDTTLDAAFCGMCSKVPRTPVQTVREPER